MGAAKNVPRVIAFAPGRALRSCEPGKNPSAVAGRYWSCFRMTRFYARQSGVRKYAQAMVEVVIAIETGSVQAPESGAQVTLDRSQPDSA